MTITTKYNVGDEVWCVLNNKVVKTKIIELSLVQAENFKWKLEEKIFITWMYETEATLPESKLFRTKEELIASL